MNKIEKILLTGCAAGFIMLNISVQSESKSKIEKYSQLAGLLIGVPSALGLAGREFYLNLKYPFRDYQNN